MRQNLFTGTHRIKAPLIVITVFNSAQMVPCYNEAIINKCNTYNPNVYLPIHARHLCNPLRFDVHIKKITQPKIPNTRRAIKLRLSHVRIGYFESTMINTPAITIHKLLNILFSVDIFPAQAPITKKGSLTIPILTF